MYEAQYLFGGTLVESVWVRTEVFSPWIPRGGDNVVITMETLKHTATSAALAVQLFHKNSEDPGEGTAVSGPSPATRTSPGISELTYTGLKELVRYKFLCTSSTEDVDDHVLFRMLSPVWYDDVKPN